MRLLFLLFICLFCLVLSNPSYGEDYIKRDSTSLLNQFYSLKNTNPPVAKKTLDLLLKQYPDNVTALKEMAYWQLQHQQQQQALRYFEKAYQLQPDSLIALQIGYLYDQLKEKNQAIAYFEKAKQTDDAAIKAKAELALHNLQPAPILPIPTLPVPVPQPQPPVIAVRQLAHDYTAAGLLNQYYQLKKDHSKEAIHSLELVIHREPNNIIALKELGFYYLNSKNNHAALYYFKKAYEFKPDNKTALQIAYILLTEKQPHEAIHYFEKVAKSSDFAEKKLAQQALQVLKQKPTATINMVKTATAAAVAVSPRDRLLNEFYAAQRSKNIAKQKTALTELLVLEPHNLIALKEMGYLYLKEKNPESAYPYFKKAYDLTGDLPLASQLGYIEDMLGHKRAAYFYFQKAALSHDPELRLRSNIATVNLAGWQSRFLPSPYFADFYASPLYYSRFDLGIFPWVARAGIYFGDKNQWEVYLSNRFTRDDRSSGSAISPNIFEDNVDIVAVGGRYQPLTTTPLYLYSEFGKSYDLIYRQRSRWRGDVRGGAFYINYWGIHPTYADTLQFPFKPNMQAYSDASYYTRYDNNFITSLRLRPGLRLVQFHSSFIDFYVKNLVIGDTNHEFYNNLFEWGPGVLVVPNNRWNLGLRYEVVRGYYFKVNSPSPNPYGSTYNNKIVLLEYYARF